MSHTAYGSIPGEQYKPYISASTNVPKMAFLANVSWIGTVAIEIVHNLLQCDLKYNK
ncbi:hypothetical protein [Pelosinus sp. UFO1]|uniref:hypothetical protein n=1 Tax=Pelosinus sp. UFO1 TaxID=484770 RepID=UPI0004D0E303|nr:hypothetical protein [Pelosinus sp. UFO1]AIF49693.1 hypothetical protein UFO1_0132 [Pelosinus sp. UFO1]